MSIPVLTVIAGANGSGKSTLTKWARDFFQSEATVDADAAAVELLRFIGRRPSWAKFIG